MEKRPVDVAVISDLHLGTYGCKANEIVAYLKSISPQLLVLNGDIIDAWQFSKHYFPASHMAVIKEIFHLLTTGTRVIYITGNHDEFLRRYADLELGNLQLTDKMVIEIHGKTTWIFHGDVFDNTTKGGAKFWARLGSNGYAVLLGFNRMVNRCSKFFGRQPVSLSRKLMKRIDKSIIRTDTFETMVADLAIRKKYDYVICGHIHQPKKRTIETSEGSVTYLNTGDWLEHSTALEYYDNDWHIYTHTETAKATAPLKKQPMQAEVMTNEIAYSLYTLQNEFKL